MTAVNSHPQFIVAKPPPAGYSNLTPGYSYNITPGPGQQYVSGFGLANITHKLVHKYGTHPCQDAPDVVCIGPYVVNQTIIKSIPPPFPPGIP